MLDRVMNYIESDVPANLTLVQWRRSRVVAGARRRRRLPMLWARARRQPALAA